jgi:hypothetical protein
MNISKGQVEVVSAVLLTGIMISLVSVAYFWGLPVIEKQKDQTKLNEMEVFMKDFNSAVKEVANEGGRRELTVNLPGTLKFVESPSYMDNITLIFDSQGSLIAPGETIYLVGDNRTEAPIGSESGIITVLSERMNGNYRIKMKLYYRNLTSGEEKYRIDLNNLGRNSIGGTQGSITIEKSETSAKIGDLYLNRVNIRFQ